MGMRGAIMTEPNTIRQALKAARYNRLFKPMSTRSLDIYKNSSPARDKAKATK